MGAFSVYTYLFSFRLMLVIIYRALKEYAQIYVIRFFSCLSQSRIVTKSCYITFRIWTLKIRIFGFISKTSNFSKMWPSLVISKGNSYFWNWTTFNGTLYHILLKFHIFSCWIGIILFQFVQIINMFLFLLPIETMFNNSVCLLFLSLRYIPKFNPFCWQAFPAF